MGIELEKKLSQAGYRMLGANKNMTKITMLILDILKSENIRYLKAIPFLIYKHDIEIAPIYKAGGTNIISLFSVMMIITERIFQEFNIKKDIPDHIHFGITETESYMKRKRLDYQEFKAEFELQLRNETKPDLFIEKQKIYAERDLQMHLSQIFTKKEKQIIRRLLEEKPISRTDYEYYSRKTKKKLNSIISLQDFARSIHSKTPKYDGDLYILKRKLEELIKQNSKAQDISVTEFYLLGNMLSIGYEQADNVHSTFAIKIGKKLEKDKSLLELLDKYQKHDFR